MPVEETSPVPRPPGVVVAAALIEDGRMLAAQRSGPAELRGQWELPGGKVDSGESERDALARECAEELGIGVEALTRVGGDWPLVGAVSRTHVLHVWTARLTAGHPVAGEAHLAVRWVAPEEWASMPWLPSDLPVLPLLAPLMVIQHDSPK